LQDFAIDLRRFGNFAIVGEEGEGEEGVREGLGQLRIEEPVLNNYPQVRWIEIWSILFWGRE
jgi:hypothetical protein